MRWAATPSSNLSFSSLSRDLSIVHQILTVLHTVPPSSLTRSLRLLSSLLTPHIVSSVLSLSPPFPQSFLFFLFASSSSRLRCLHSHHLAVASLCHHQQQCLTPLSLTELLPPSSSPIPSAAFSAHISASSSSPEKALETFALMPRPDAFTYNTVLNLLMKNNAAVLAVALYKRMLASGCAPNRSTFLILISGLCSSGNFQDAFLLFDEMDHRGLPPDAFVCAAILSAHCSRGDIAAARDFVDLMRSRCRPNCRPDAVIYSILLGGLCRWGQVDEAFQQLRTFEEEEEGFEIGLKGYSSMIDGLFRAKRAEDARNLFDKMLVKGLQPDCILYTIMMRGYAEAGMLEDAFLLLGEMASRGVAPDTYCYNTLIKGLCDAGRLDQARSLWMEISQPDSITHTIFISKLCGEGLVNEAEEVFNEMGRRGCSPTVMTFNSLITGLCKAGKLEKAFLLFLKMETGRSPSYFIRRCRGAQDAQGLRNRVEKMCEAGEVVAAYKLINSGTDPDVVTYNILIHGLLKSGDPDGARNLFKMLQLKGKAPDEVTFGTLIDGLMKLHREKDANELYIRMVENGMSPSLSICNTLMKFHCRRKQVSKAVSLWLAHILKLSAGPEEARVIEAMKKLYMQGHVGEAVKGLVKMDRERGSVVNSSPYNIWLIGFCQAHQADKALMIFNALTEFDVEVSPPSCAVLMRSLCREGKLASGLSVMLYALRKGISLMQPAGNYLIHKLCVANKKKEAHELVWRMSLAGYDMNTYLTKPTQRLLYNQRTDGA